MARQKGFEVPNILERFFDALEGGDWNEIEAAFKTVNGADSNGA